MISSFADISFLALNGVAWLVCVVYPSLVWSIPVWSGLPQSGLVYPSLVWSGLGTTCLPWAVTMDPIVYL